MNRHLSLLCLILVALAPPPIQAAGYHTKSKDREELLTKLRRDIVKVERAIGATSDLIAKSQAAPYLPDLYFRLAELYVEKSRYVYFEQAELQGDSKGALVVPESRLLKNKALAIYNRVLKDFPEYKDSDKILFFIAHEQRELGQFDKMIETHERLIKERPSSPLRLESLLILGDHHFDKGDAKKAEEYYQQILASSSELRSDTPVQDMARYKLGWIRVHEGNHAEAVKLFEAAAGVAVNDSGDKKSLNLKREALADLVFSYTEARPPKGAVSYFARLANDPNLFAMVMEKLGKRYFIKQQYEYAVPAYRKLVELARDVELDVERAAALYDAIKAARGKVLPKASDVSFIVRTAALARSNFQTPDEERKRIDNDFEIYARDLSTLLHKAAQSKDDKQLASEAADAYRSYLSLFHVEKWRAKIERNEAEALFLAERFVEAGRRYEKLALALPAAQREEPLYSAITSYYSALTGERPLNHYETTTSRSAIKQIGAYYVRTYPRSERAATVKYNVARAFFQDGEFQKAAEAFAAFASDYPSHKDTAAAVNGALECYHSLSDYDAMEKQGRAFLANARLPSGLRADVKKVLEQTVEARLEEAALRSGAATGDAGKGLLEIADQKKGTELGLRALYVAFSTYREKRDVAHMAEIAKRLIAEYPKAAESADALSTTGQFALDSADFDAATAAYEELYRRFPGETAALAAVKRAANLRLLIGDWKGAAADLERAVTEAPRAARSSLNTLLSEARLQGQDAAGAQTAAEAALKDDAGAVRAAVVLGQVLLAAGRAEQATQQLAQVIRAFKSSGKEGADMAYAGRVAFLLGEAMFRQFNALPANALEQKVGMIQPLEASYADAAQLGSPEWAIGGLYRLGLVYGALADALAATPIPAGLSQAQQTKLRDTIAGQVEPVRARAAEIFEACARKSREIGAYTPFTAGCAAKKAVDEAPPPLPAAGQADPAQVAALSKRLAERPGDLEIMEQLALTFLSARDFRRARLVYNQATDIDPGRASLHNGMALALASLGELEKAGTELERALDADERFDKARANRAALRCRFGDEEGAREDLALLHETPQPGPDLDPGYARCQGK